MRRPFKKGVVYYNLASSVHDFRLSIIQIWLSYLLYMAVIFVLYSNVMRWVKITTGKPGIHQGAILSAVVSQRDKTYVMF